MFVASDRPLARDAEFVNRVVDFTLELGAGRVAEIVGDLHLHDRLHLVDRQQHGPAIVEEFGRGDYDSILALLLGVAHTVVFRAIVFGPAVVPLFDGVTAGVFGGRTIDASTIDGIEEALYAADFGVETTTEVLDEIRAAFKKDKELRGHQAAELGAEVLRRVLAGAEGVLAPSATKPVVIALIGVNGSGKTTTAAKLAWDLKQDGASVTVGACDTFRAAANEQLAAMLGETTFTSLSHQGASDSVYLVDLARRAILVIVFGRSVTLGLVRIRARRTVPELNALLEEVFSRDLSRGRRHGLHEGWATDAADEVDRVFGGW